MVHDTRTSVFTSDLLRDVWLLAVTVFVVAATTFGYTANRDRIQDTERVIHAINSTASKALVLSTLGSEKVCSQSNQGSACRALFDRLARNLSPAQRKRLGCDVIAVLDGPGIREIRKASRCPKPIRSP